MPSIKNHSNYNSTHPKPKNKKEKPHDTFPPHQPQHPATPADTDPHPIILFSTHLRAPVLIISATAHTLNYTLLTTPCPHTACRHCTHHLFYHPSPLYHHPCLHSCPQLYPCLSRSRYRSPSTCVPLLDGRRYALHRLATTAYLYRYQPDCCLHTVHMSVCTTVLTHLVIMLNVLGSAPVLTTIHLSHLLCVTPVTCATTSPLRESTHTPCRFHHPYRSLTLAHRVVPPLVVPVPSLAVSGVRLSCVVPLVGESPLADARLRLTPMVTCCSLSARPHSHPSIHYSCQHPSCTHTCSHSFQHSC